MKSIKEIEKLYALDEVEKLDSPVARDMEVKNKSFISAQMAAFS